MSSFLISTICSLLDLFLSYNFVWFVINILSSLFEVEIIFIIMFFFLFENMKMISDVCLFFFLDFLLYVFFLLIMLSIRNLTFRSLRYICFILKLKYWSILSFLFAFFFYSRFLLVVVVVVVGDTKQMFIILYLFCLIDYRITNIAFLISFDDARSHISISNTINPNLTLFSTRRV
jgi:hypothetical protein